MAGRLFGGTRGVGTKESRLLLRRLFDWVCVCSGVRRGCSAGVNPTRLVGGLEERGNAAFQNGNSGRANLGADDEALSHM